MIFNNCYSTPKKMDLNKSESFNMPENFKGRLLTCCFILFVNVMCVCIHIFTLNQKLFITLSILTGLCCYYIILYKYWNKIYLNDTKAIRLLKNMIIVNYVGLLLNVLIGCVWYNDYFKVHYLITYLYNLDFAVIIIPMAILFLKMFNYDTNSKNLHKTDNSAIWAFILYFVLAIVWTLELMFNLAAFPYFITTFWSSIWKFLVLTLVYAIYGRALSNIFPNKRLNTAFFIGQLLVLLIFIHRHFYVPNENVLNGRFWYKWVKNYLVDGNEIIV